MKHRRLRPLEQARKLAAPVVPEKAEIKFEDMMVPVRMTGELTAEKKHPWWGSCFIHPEYRDQRHLIMDGHPLSRMVKSMVRDQTREVSVETAKALYNITKGQMSERLAAWQRNFKKNEKLMWNGTGMGWLPNGIHYDKAAVIVGAGPSLELNHHLLENKEFRANAIVIAQNKSLRYAHNPDYFLTIDYEGREEWYRDTDTLPDGTPQGNELDVSKTTALLNILASPLSVRRNWKDIKFFCPTEPYEFGHLNTTRLSDIGRLDSGYHCTYSAIQAAYWMGCDPIILIGCDYSFPGMKLHVGDQSPIDNKKTDYINKGKECVDVFTRGKVWSHPIYLKAMLSTMASLFFVSQRVGVINASERGTLNDFFFKHFILKSGGHNNHNPILEGARLEPKIALARFSSAIEATLHYFRQRDTKWHTTAPTNSALTAI